MAVTVTVGRNVRGAPMPLNEWTSFREEVVEAVRRNVGAPYFTGTGIGDSAEWGQEEAFTVVAPEPYYSDIREALDYDLSKVGLYYGQEAVAVTEGLTRFIP